MIHVYLKKIFNNLWSLFVNGLLTILPITITFGLFSFSFGLLKRWVAPLKLIIKIPFLQAIPHNEVILAFVIIFISGILFKSLVMRSLVDILEMFVAQVPLVRPVYQGIKTLVHAFSPSDTHSFQKVVLIEFPRKGIFSLGFQTSELVSELNPSKTETYCNIFVPTTPNPTTGYFIMVKKEELIVVDLTTQEAMTLIISGGIVQPHRFTDKQI